MSAALLTAAGVATLFFLAYVAGVIYRRVVGDFTCQKCGHSCWSHDDNGWPCRVTVATRPDADGGWDNPPSRCTCKWSNKKVRLNGERR